MDLKALSPVEIDTVLSDLYNKEASANARVHQCMESIFYKADAKKNYYSRRPEWNMAWDEALGKVSNIAEHDTTYRGREAKDALERYEAAVAVVRDIRDQAKALNAEFQRRGGWTRAFLVRNTNGHVHSSMDCSTCFPETFYAWMVNYSGMDEDTIVADAGERACTICYPSAPVSTLSRPTKMFTPEEVEAAKAREERAAKKAKAEAEKIEVDGIVDYDRPRTKVFKTERAAWLFAVGQRKDVLSWGGDHPSVPTWVANAERVEKALADVTGRSLEDIRTDVAARAEKAYKRSR